MFWVLWPKARYDTILFEDKSFASSDSMMDWLVWLRGGRNGSLVVGPPDSIREDNSSCSGLVLEVYRMYRLVAYLQKEGSLG